MVFTNNYKTIASKHIYSVLSVLFWNKSHSMPPSIQFLNGTKQRSFIVNNIHMNLCAGCSGLPSIHIKTMCTTGNCSFDTGHRHTAGIEDGAREWTALGTYSLNFINHKLTIFLSSLLFKLELVVCSFLTHY